MTRASSPCHICLTSRYILRKALHHLIPAGKPLGAAHRPFLGGFVRAEVAAVFCQLRTAVYLDTTDLLENVGVRTDTFTEELHAALIRVAPTRSLAGQTTSQCKVSYFATSGISTSTSSPAAYLRGVLQHNPPWLISLRSLKVSSGWPAL